MTREEEIVVETLAQEFQSVTPKVPSPINSAYGMGFYEGAQWADEHISEDNIHKFLKLYNDWWVKNEEGTFLGTEFDYIKQHLNDE